MYPLFLRTWRFYDFTEFQDKFTYFHQATFFQILAFTLLSSPRGHCLRWIYAVRIYALSAYLVFCFLTFIGAALLLDAQCAIVVWDSAGIFFIGSSMLLSYPFWFLVDRANIEMVNWLLVALEWPVIGTRDGILPRVLWRCDFLQDVSLCVSRAFAERP